MADIFLMLGIIVSVIVADAIVCLVLTVLVETKLDSDLFLMPALLVNSFCFVVLAVDSIYEMIAR